MYKLLLSFTFFILSATAFSQNIVGNWEGVLQIPGSGLPIIFHIDKDSADKYVAAFDSPAQKFFNNPCSDVILKGDSLILGMAILKGKYAGKLSKDNMQLTGNFYQGSNSLPLILNKTSSKTTVKKVNRPQTPVPPFPYKSEDVEYDNANKSIHFGATFTVPLPEPNTDNIKAPVYPTVLLITGSGPQDRDENILDHKPFAVIADYLTRQGIAVLRVDDRSKGKTNGNFATSTTLDFALDVEAGINYLKSRKDVDTFNIGLIGHSEGGIIAPMVASRRKDIGFIILLAGPGINVLDMMEQQSADVMASTGILKTDIDFYRPLYRNLVTAIINAKDTVTASKKAMAIFKKWQKGKSAATIKNTTGIEAEKDIPVFTNSFVKQLSSPWFSNFVKMNPQNYLTKTNCPVLALNGEKDIQVAAKSNLAGIKTALQKNNNIHVTTMEMSGLNHLFQHCKKCSADEYGELEETFDTATLKIMLDWIKTGRFK
jgi:uncharacterized protein